MSRRRAFSLHAIKEMKPTRASHRARFVASIVAAVSTAAPAMACPRCAAGITARSEVWQADFGFNLFVAVVPFFFMGVVSFVVERIGKPSGAHELEKP